MGWSPRWLSGQFKVYIWIHSLFISPENSSNLLQFPCEAFLPLKTSSSEVVAEVATVTTPVTPPGNPVVAPAIPWQLLWPHGGSGNPVAALMTPWRPCWLSLPKRRLYWMVFVIFYFFLVFLYLLQGINCEVSHSHNSFGKWIWRSNKCYEKAKRWFFPLVRMCTLKKINVYSMVVRIAQSGKALSSHQRGPGFKPRCQLWLKADRDGQSLQRFACTSRQWHTQGVW